MKTVSISNLKAKLSQYLDAVKAGEEVLVTDRGRPVARISRVAPAEDEEGRLQALVRTGRVRPPRRTGELDLESLRPPADPRGRALNALLEERREGR